MAKDRCTEITLHLATIHDLFTPPAIDPFSNNASFLSGIEYIKSELPSTLFRSGERLKTTIFLPAQSIEPGLAAEITLAMRRYCQFKARQNRRAMAALRRQALVAMLLGILFLAGGLVLSQLLARASFLPPLLSTLFSDGFVIAFWVILWRPVDFFLFELWPFWKEDRVYKRLMKMEINVVGETKPGALSTENRASRTRGRRA